MKAGFRFFCTFVILVAAVFVFALPAAARTTHAASYVRTGYTGSESIFSPEDGNGVRLFDMTADWDFLGDAMHVRRYLQNGCFAAYAILDTDECDGETTFTLSLADDLSDYSVLCIGIGMTARYVSLSPIRAELELSDSGGNRVISETLFSFPENENGGIRWGMVYLDLSGFEERGDAAELSLRLTYDPELPPNVIRITNPYAAADDDDGFSCAARYLTDSLKASSGTFGMTSGKALPGEESKIHLSGTFVLAEQPKIGSDVFLEIRLSHVVSGNLSVTIGGANGETIASARVSLTSSGPETNNITSVVFPIHVTGHLQTLNLAFDEMDCKTYFKIESIRLHDAGRVEMTPVSDLGKVTGLTHSGTDVVFAGVMEREAVKEYAASVLRFYAISGWTSDDTGTAVVLGETKVSTRFEYTVDLSAYPQLADTYRFFAAVVTDEGELLPLSAPMYPAAADLANSAVSNVGLYDAASVGVFESNASHVLVDIPLDELLNAEDSGDASLSLSYTVYETAVDETGEENLIVTRTEQKGVNHSLLRRLDSEINFYISAGVEVCLRLTSDSVIPGLTYEEPGAYKYGICLETPEARSFYTSLVRFLCRRYSGICGLVTGDGVNLGLYNGGGVDDENAAEYAWTLAELCRITYNAASAEIPDVLVILPFRHYFTDGNEVFRYLDPTTLTVMMSSYLEEIGPMAWVMMDCVEDWNGAELSENDSAVQRIRQLTEELNLKGFADWMYLCEPSYEMTMYSYYAAGTETESYSAYLAEAFAKLCSSTRARAVFLSLAELDGRLEHEFYFCLKNAGDAAESGLRQRSVSDYAAVPADALEDALNACAGQAALWDFTDEFYPLDWMAVGGVSSCQTVYSELFSAGRPEGARYARVLRSVIARGEERSAAGGRATAAGIALCNLSRSADLRGVDYVEFTFALNRPETDTAEQAESESGTVVFVLGSDDCRAEFEVEKTAYGQVLRYVCDLSDYEYRDKVDYVGIMVYVEDEVYLDLSSVKAYSKSLTAEDLAAVFAPPAEEDGRKTDFSAVLLVSVIVFVLSASTAALLIRRDAEEQREREKRQREEKRPKREQIRRR
ncbi:MAG: hypothetical protein ACI4V1_03600 [Eubacteriales bacterium]